jgi:4-hydroxymandelate oxidase
MTNALDGLINLLDFEPAAEATLPVVRFANVVGGACDEITLRENRLAFDRWRLLPRALVDINDATTETSVLGVPTSMPILVAPTASHRRYHAEGEAGTARGAAAVGAICCISAAASCTAPEIRAAAPDAPRFFMFGATRDVGLQRTLIEQAEELGARAVIFTTDSQVVGRRERAMRAGHETAEMGLLSAALGHDVDITKLDMRLTWDGLERAVADSPLPVLLKGILAPDDAARACDYGVAGVIVSNHGGRQLDSVPATLDALPAIVDAVGDRIEVLLDGGVRRGTDVLKALALGARAVLIGRPCVYGLAIAGAHGVQRALELLQAETLTALQLLGCPSPELVTREFLTPAVGSRSVLVTAVD